MKNVSTVFNQVLNLIPYSQIQKTVDEFNGDKYTKKFNSFHHFVTLLYAQITEKNSLRDIERPININKGKIQYFSLPEIKRSTLAEANNRRDYRIFEKIFYVLLDKTMKLTPKHKFKFKNPLYSLDSTTIDLCLSIFDWAKFRKTKGAIKIHTKLNHNGNIPDFLVITDGKGSDIKTAKANFDFLPDSIVVKDKGYIDFEWLFSLNKKGVFFVTRAKDNMAYRVTGQHKFTEGTGVISDEEIVLTCPKSVNAYPEKLRMVKYYDIETNKIYTFITNNFKLAAKTIADIYKDRWQVELFFKWIKQNLKIKSFLGITKNAVMSQIWVAMTTYLIYCYMKFQTKCSLSILDFSRVIKETLFQKVSIIDLLSLNPDRLREIEFDEDWKQLKLAF
jgi:hypothetical protein